jgi:TorA maturation chaperone TorD
MNLATVAANGRSKTSMSPRHTVHPEHKTNNPVEDVWITDRARLVIYQFLSLATSKPHNEAWSRILEPNYLELVQTAIDIIRHDPRARPESLAAGELSLEALDFTSLKSFLQNHLQDFCDEYDRVFGLLLSKECPPYETQYCPQTFSVFRSHQLGDIAGYYRAFGLEPSRESPERHDHISLELEFMAWLNTKMLYAMEQGDTDNENLCRDAQMSFLDEHLAWWTTAFALALRRKADGIKDERELTSPPQSFQGAVGVLLAAFIAAERGFLGIAAPTNLVAPREGGDSQGCDTIGCESCAVTIDTTMSTLNGE